VTEPTAAIVSFRLGGTDGVAIEAAKWKWALEQRGFSVTTVAGGGPVDRFIPSLAMDALHVPKVSEISDALSGADLVIVENICSLPLNPPAASVIAGVLQGRRAVMHHHDLPWQREATASMPPPPDDAAWLHVTINEVSRKELSDRGIEATVVRNCFDVSATGGDRKATRELLGISEEQRVVLQPTRAIPRKNIPGGIAIAEAVGATYWLLGAAEDGYGPELERILAGSPVPVIAGTPDGTPLNMSDAYAACDVVAMPSFWEGFGNPSLESAVHRRPLCIGPYPVGAELARFGFDWFGLGDLPRLAEWLEHPDGALLERNFGVAQKHFSLEDLPERLGSLFAGAGWTGW